MNYFNIPNETLQTLLLTDLRLEDGGKYTCVVSNMAGHGSASTHIFIELNFVTQPMDITQEIGSSGNLSCVAEAFPYPEYQWERVDGEPIRPDIVTNESTLFISFIMFGDEGGYSCNATSIESSITSLPATIYGKVVTELVHAE